MGLDVMVGATAWRAVEHPEETEQDREELAELNALLRANGVTPHSEPEQLEEAELWSERVGSYGALHYARRVAAYLTMRGALPPPENFDEKVNDDPVVIAAYEAIKRHRDAKPRFWRRLLGRAERRPVPFEHLIWHSDCEGFYVPVDFPSVIERATTPGQSSPLEMVGSSIRLLAECDELLGRLNPPAGLHYDDEILDEPGEAAADGAWRAFPIATRVLLVLKEAAERSIRTGSLITFC